MTAAVIVMAGILNAALASESGLVNLKETRDRVCFLGGSVKDAVAKVDSKGGGINAEGLANVVRRYFEEPRNAQQCKEELERYCKAGILAQGRLVGTLTAYFRSVRPPGPRTNFRIDPKCGVDVDNTEAVDE